jgi:hypothetical protein
VLEGILTADVLGFPAKDHRELDFVVHREARFFSELGRAPGPAADDVVCRWDDDVVIGAGDGARQLDEVPLRLVRGDPVGSSSP